MIKRVKSVVKKFKWVLSVGVAAVVVAATCALLLPFGVSVETTDGSIGISIVSQSVVYAESFGTKQVLVAGRNDATHATNTEYNGIMMGYNWGTEALMSQLMPTDGTISDFRLYTLEAPGEGKSYTFTVMLNGSPTSLEIEVADSATSGYDTNTEHAVAVTTWDYVSVRCVPSGTPTVCHPHWTFIFEGSTSGESLILTNFRPLNSSTRYMNLHQSNAQYRCDTEAEAWTVWPTSGVIKKMYVQLSVDPGTDPDAYKFTLNKVGVGATDLTCTIVANDITGYDDTHEVSVSAGDILTLEAEPLNSPGYSPTAWVGMVFVADVAGESVIAGGDSLAMSNSATKWNFLTPGYYAQDWGNAELPNDQLGQTCTFKKLHVALSGSPGEGTSYDFMVRVNSDDSALGFSISDTDTTGNSSTNETAINDDDLLGFQTTPNNTPAAVACFWSVVGYIEPTGGEPNISVSPTSYNFGLIAEGATPYTPTDNFTITNSSTIQTDQTISVTTDNWSGGIAWVHSDGGIAGANIAALLANRGGTWGSGDVVVKYTSPDYIYENCPASTSYSFGLKLLAPTEFYDGVEKTITVRISAAAG